MCFLRRVSFSNSSTSEGGASIQGPAASTLEPASNVVGSTEKLSEETAPASIDIAGDASSATLEPHASQSPGSGPTPGMPVEVRLKALDFSDSVIKRIESSRASSTCKHYQYQWELFPAWTTERKLNQLDASLPLLTSFMD